MQILLPKHKDPFLLKMLSGMDAKNELDLQEGCYWVGSCSGEIEKVEKYISLAKEGNLAEMAKSDYLGDDAVYAVVVKDRICKGTFNIFIAVTCFGVNPQIEILHTSRFESDCDVVPSNATHQPLTCRPQWWHYLVGVFFPGKGVGLALNNKK